MKKDPLIFIGHILESIERVDSFMKNVSKNRFFKDELIQSAVVRQIEIMGEAVKNLPTEFIERYSSIPWRGIAGIRDKIIHHYFGIDIEFIYNIVKNNLPKLKKQMKDILNKK